MNAPSLTHFGRYRIVEELGRGAMGIVYLAEDESLQRQVAVKTMLLPADSAERTEQEGRFRQEAKAAGALNHPNIITIHDLGREGDWLYIAMELLRGSELRTLMTAGLLPLPLALDIAAQVADGLAAAHAQGVVHRDIKPSNIMVLGGRHAKIMDFGVARMQASELRTRSGMLLGSPKYMSPEQVGGHPVDARSDIFSLGAMLYEMVAGVPAFGGEQLGNLLSAILHAHPPPPSRIDPALPPVLDLIVARAMQKNAAARYQDAQELARDLRDCAASVGGAPLAAGTHGGTSSVRGTVDLYAATAVGSAAPAVTASPHALVPSPQFDASAALHRMQRDLRDPAAAAAAETSRRWLPGAWTFTSALAAAAAVAIALA